jgi:hypothetical protein
MRSALPRLAGTSAVVAGSFSVAAVLPAAVPASGVVVDPLPEAAGAATATATSPLPSAGSVAAASPGRAASVTPDVREVPVPRTGGRGASSLAAKSRPEPVEGFGVVGATWLGRRPDGLRLDVRTRTRGSWSPWRHLEGGSCPCPARTPAQDTDVGADGPNAGSLEARRARRGTDPLAVGEVDAVQLRATSVTGQAPRDLQLSVIEPGRSISDRDAASATLMTEPGGAIQAEPALFVASHVPGVRAPRPRIRSRASWGADERLRSSAPRYGKVKAGFAHHTVNANRYSRSDVPPIIRGIYAYHTQSLGWSDIGYNFLVDRFGRKWVGRYGGPRRAVIGAHTYGYNHLSTGIAAIGDFESRRPSFDMVRALGRMMGWKLGLHGVRAGDRGRWLDGKRFRAVNGHRDAGPTACPGIKLYRRLPDVRRIAVRWQHR